MTRDASLDEFLGGESDVSEASEVERADSAVESGEVGSEAGESGVEEDGGESGEAVSPASPTYVWTPAGDACARCGSSVDRLWRCDGELVCGECKEW